MAEPYAEEFAQVLAWLQERTPLERRAFLHSAGILDAQGQLSKRYAPPEEFLQQQGRLATSGYDLRLHSSVFNEPGPWYVTLGDSSANYVVGCGKTPGEAVDSALKAVQSINLQNPPR